VAADKNNAEGPRTIHTAFGKSSSGPFEDGPEVKVIPQSNGVDEFWERAPVIGEPSASATPLTSLGSYSSREFSVYDYYGIPPISAHHRLLVSFLGSYNTPEESAVFEEGSVVQFRDLGDPSQDYTDTVAALPGDVLSAFGQLHNGSFRSTSVHTRVRLKSHHKGAFEWVALYISQPERGEFELGHGTVNAEPGHPISLRIVPRSTELRTAPTKCSQETREQLPDGITEGGLNISGVGGFKQRDPCHGTEFTKYVFFKLRVSRATHSGTHRARDRSTERTRSELEPPRAEAVPPEAVEGPR
jgi:hypothetical protein